MSLRKLSTNALAAVGNVLVSALLLFELYRFLARELGAEDIGVWSLVMATVAAARLGEAGLGGGTLKYVANDLGAGRRDGAAGTIGMTLVAIALLMGLICAALHPLAHRMLALVLPGGEPLSQGRALLPWALVSLWVTSVANVFASSLDAMQRTPIRAGATIAAGTVQLLGAYLFVPHHGLAALGPLQLALSCTLLAIVSGATLWLLGDARTHLFRFPRARAKEMLAYGGSYQLIALGQLAFEPSVKWLIGGFGTLAQNGFYELANRAVMQARLVIAAAYQMIVPYVATRIGRDGDDRAHTAAAYLQAWRLLVLVGIPWFTFVGCALPALLTFWLGRAEPDMLLFGYLALGGWAINTAALPAFVIYLAVGRMRWNVTTQLVIGGLNLALAGLGGALAGGVGVVAGAMLALAIGSLVVVVAFHREYAIPVTALADRSAALLAGLGALAVAAAGALSARAAVADDAAAWLALGPVLIAYGLCSTWLLWRDPLRRDLLARLRPARTSATGG